MMRDANLKEAIRAEIRIVVIRDMKIEKKMLPSSEIRKNGC